MNILSMMKDEKDTFKAAPTPERLKKNVRVAILTSDKTQDLEFFYPYYRLNEEGYDVDIFTLDGGKFEGKQGMGLKDTKSIKEARASDYALLYIPGGKAPAEIRKDDSALAFVREFAATGKPIAAICHGPQVLITAGLVRGKRMACWPEVRKELEEAGGIFVDEALVEDGQFITARQPGDLPRHLWGVLDVLQGHRAPTKQSA
jgi:protease I